MSSDTDRPDADHANKSSIDDDEDEDDIMNDDESPESSSNIINSQVCPSWKGSLVEYLGPNESYCGYCKRNDDRSNGRQSNGK